jgi:hypothetical protein
VNPESGNGSPPCVSCGSPLVAGAVACAACGKLAAPQPLAPAAPEPLAATKMSRTADVLFGILIGGVGGVMLAGVLVLTFLAIGSFAEKSHEPVLLFAGVGGELLVLVAMLAAGIRFAARGRVMLGTSLIVAGIVAALPTAACDLMFYGMGKMS